MFSVVLGAFVDACKHSGWHLVTIEGDSFIYNAILAPLCDGNILVTCGSVPHFTNLTLTFNDDKNLFEMWWSNLVSIINMHLIFELYIIQYFVFKLVLVHASNYLFWCEQKHDNRDFITCQLKIVSSTCKCC